MSDEGRSEMDDELRPIDFLAVGLPDGEIICSGFAMLLDLADSGVMAIPELVAKRLDGHAGQGLL